MELPPEIGLLSSLEILHIGKNDMTDLPAEIGLLSNLVELHLVQSGPMLNVPTEISNLRNLEILFIDKTTRLPHSVSTLYPNLKIFVY